MVFGGKPSTGCHLCRKRKIKCDEGRPECKNCAIHGKPCPGYRVESVFRNETKKVERQVKTQWAVQPQAMDRYYPLTLHSIADSTWEERALCFFFDQYTIDPGVEEGMGNFEYLPRMYVHVGNIKEPPASGLISAVNATALMTFANAVHAPSLMVQARKSYGKALRSLQLAVSSPTQAAQDETFASVILLSLYEDITSDRNNLLSSHTAGFDFLMKVRGENQLDDQQGRAMFSFAYIQTYVEILMLGDKPRHDIDWIQGLLDKNNPVESLMIATCSVSQLFRDMQSATSPPHEKTIRSWIATSHECDFELLQWPLHIHENWLPLNVYSDNGEFLITYKCIAKAIVWNYYRAVRIMVQHVLLDLGRSLTSIIQKSGRPSDPCVAKIEESDPNAIIQELTTDVCQTLPFALADVDILGRPTKPGVGRSIRSGQGYGLLWPLWYILSNGMPTPEQIAQIQSTLYRIGSTLGINLALTLARETEPLSSNHKSKSRDV
ncbi:hypothetical protein N7495_000415 [Penicillium taxi]|uniref:uncharacterized protein n=1 Tax=Penicillium taxi TaxID=168475 RepID=UPI002544F830|nr:uncharacterized protein N7495_000415 [Penicillium taxi]KAJ5907733.1 hypothetical protein N7495_000415 [Penicillium taxi]